MLSASKSTNPGQIVVPVVENATARAKRKLAKMPAVKPFTCPVFVLMMEYEELVKAHNADDNHIERRKGDDHFNEISKRLWQIKEAVSYLSPMSPEGAAFQIMLAAGEPDYIEGGSTGEVKEAACRRCNRLLYRALERFDDAADTFPNTREFLMPKRLDPNGDL